MAIIKQPCDPVNHPAHYTDGRIEGSSTSRTRSWATVWAMR